ncbi:MAG: HD domain-containing protein, partial [Clostridia bacterium]|nr:HD domain-containing protein [Clostridia bacterium]
MAVRLPDIAEKIIEKLSLGGHSALAYGCCVRDALTGKTASVIDIATNASQLGITKRFGNCRIPHGLKDTVIVTIGSETAKIIIVNAKDEEELAKKIKERFDSFMFTADTLISGLTEFYDDHGAEEHIRLKTLKTAGDPLKCCTERPETILRALAYMSKYALYPCKELSDAILEKKSLVKTVQREEAFALFNEILTGDNAGDTIRRYVDVIAEFIPQIKDCIGFEQKSKYHCFDVFEHTLKAIDSSSNDLIVRTALLFHDIGKPYTYTFDGQSGHFHGHNKKSADIARSFLHFMNADAYTVKLISTLVYVHDMKSSPTQQNAEKMIARYGLTNAKRLLEIQRADILAHHPDYTNTSSVDKLEQFMDKAISENKCVSVKQLAVSGTE